MNHGNLYLFAIIATYRKSLDMKSCDTKRKIYNNNSGALRHKHLRYIFENKVERLESWKKN